MSTPYLKRKIDEDNYQEYPIESPTCTVGRSGECDITINDTSLSRLHMRLENRNGTFFLLDNNSSNGTFLNRRKIKEAPLIDGDHVIAGRVHFLFEHTLEGAGPVTKPMPVINSINATVSGDLVSFDSGDNFIALPQEDQAFSAAPEPPPLPVSGMDTRNTEAQGGKALPQARILAALIDGAVALACFLPSMAISALLGPGLTSFLVSLVGLAASMAHVIVGWSRFNKTIGKHYMGLRIENTDLALGTALAPKTVALRLLGYLICCATCGLLFGLVLFDPDGRGLHDKIAGTRVVRDDNP